MLPAQSVNPFWSVVDAETGKPLAPRAYSTGLTQDEAVKAILAPFRAARRAGREQDVFFIAGTGSGKSLVALNVAARVGGRAIVSAPTVNLQDQYEDAALSKRVLKPNGKPVSVASVKGRRRYACPFEGGTAADPHVCQRGGKNKDRAWRKAATCPHWAPTMTRPGFEALVNGREDILRTESIDPKAAEFLNHLDENAVSFHGINGEEYVHVGRRGCGYFDAHAAFADPGASPWTRLPADVPDGSVGGADVVVLSNAKWQVETELGRKPRVELEVFDEADGFLDELFDEQRVTSEGVWQLLERISFAAKVLSLPEEALRDPEEMKRRDPDPERLPDPQGYLALQSLGRRLRTFEKPEDFNDEKTWRALEAVPRMLSGWPKLALDRLRHEFAMHPWASVYVEQLLVGGSIQDDDENIVAKIKGFVESKDSLLLAYDATGVYFTYSNLAAPLRRLAERSAPLRLWMSATFPSEQILRRVYGFRDPVIVQGEPRFQGTLRVMATKPPKITHTTWQEKGTRQAFVEALHDVFRRIPADEQAIVLVHGKQRLLDVAELSPIARWLAGELEDDGDRHEARLDAFFRGERKVLASTRIARGVDFAGDKARHVVVIKDPLPNLRSRRFQILEKKWGSELLFTYADDIASRTLAQMVGRGLRHEEDWVKLWMLDSQVGARLARITAQKAQVVEEAPPRASRSLDEVVRALPPHPPRPVPPAPKAKKAARSKKKGSAS
ncbi:MAG TPA: helicase C-terminal domain-containing protein [Candidatus Thermoplasmatota archaeon]|nr:helicase C-terminal domain-containing protein [Candidatus Thermoplasmatota archaeon]